MLMDYFDAYASRYQPYKGGSWCYEDGCIYQGLRQLHEATGDARWLAHLVRMVDAQVDADGRIRGYDPTEYNIDNLLSGRVLFYLHAVTGQERYLTAARSMQAQLAGHPRTETGNFWHKQIYPDQVWLDGLYMGLPFQVELGQATGQACLVGDALCQIQQALALTASTGGLYVHGTDVARKQRWADPVTGKSPAHWARALGWLAMALVDVIDDIGPARSRLIGLAQQTQAVLGAIAQFVTSDGLWLQVIDQSALPGNYTESSASAMFAYAFQKAARLGLAVDRAVGETALAGLAARVRPDGNGVARLEGICAVAGLGGFGAVYRDGTPAYYLTEPVVSDDAKGVGPLMMAAAEHARVERGVARAA
jgi:unsaturated rhamnogalacturonyl hydrolase